MDELILTEEYRLGTVESAVVTLDPAATYTGAVSVDGVMTDAEASDPDKRVTHIILKALYPGQQEYVSIGSMDGWRGGPPSGNRPPTRPSFGSGFSPGNPPLKLKAEVGFGSGGVAVKCGFRIAVPTA